MKKRLLFAATLIGVVAMAQTGKVGVQTENPTETFQVKGTTRITDLPENGKQNAIHTKSGGIEASATKNQAFEAVKTVVVDKNGVLGVVDGLPQTKRVEYAETQPFAPQRKCVKGTVTGDGSAVSSEIIFGNYAFQLQQDDDKFDIHMKGSDTTVRSTEMGGKGGVPDSGLSKGANKTIESTAYTKIADNVNYKNSDAYNSTVIVSDTSETFNFFVRTISVDKQGAVYSFCVEQMVF